MMSIIKIRNSFLRSWVLTLIITVSGCTGHVANLHLVSTKPIDLQNASMDIRKGKKVTGEDCGYALLGIIPLAVPSLEDAVDDALEQTKGNVLVEAEASASFFYAIVLSQSCMTVTGTALQIDEMS